MVDIVSGLDNEAFKDTRFRAIQYHPLQSDILIQGCTFSRSSIHIIRVPFEGRILFTECCQITIRNNFFAWKIEDE